MTGYIDGKRPEIGAGYPDLRFVGEATLARAFPPINSQNFRAALPEEWAATIGRPVKGKAFSLYLASTFRSRRNAPDRFNIFILWLCLCIDRPWNKGWKFSITENMFKKVEDILDKNNILTPDLPDFSTLRKRLAQLDSANKILDAALRPELDLAAYAISLAFRAPRQFSEHEKRAIKATMGFVGLTKNGPIIKRDIIRKLRLSRSEVDQLITWAGPKLKSEGRGRGSVWILRA